ncbi:pre-mRNA 3' end processing protein WDR33-like [Anneissia japonica]|uniref:pre-mRNA 3' end processing protein WDR33-like n=1 Tax=Anneissia japonica TaxID=1529436 RepID=UPI0014259CA7|nr:pre-mRNA 3' end processing protein WDR33-like [Anneissia japonica]
MHPLQPDNLYSHEMVCPCEMIDNPINAVSTKFVRTATNKIRCPIFCVVWTPEGRRLVTGASSGEFTLWNGMTFNFETILQAHDYPIRSMVWSHNNLWLMSGDHMGYVKYWQSNMNNVRMFQAHVDQAIREITFSPTDSKFATCSDDGSVRVFDFFRCHEERILRGHGADVKCLDWHPQKSIIVSGSKDSQQPVKLWDAKSGLSLATIHAHKSTVMSAKWNRNGNWLLTASRDHLVKVFDLRAMKEMSICRGHKKEATCVAWHPYFEDIFASGGSDGSLLYWQVGHEKEVGGIEQAHDSIVWSLAWHPLGHILCSGSNDHSTKFWTRNRPGDKMRDKYNLNTLPQGMFDDAEYDDDNVTLPAIPGMGLDQSTKEMQEEEDPAFAAVIPGLDSSAEELAQLKPTPQRKVPYAKPIPADFQRKWEAKKAPGIAPKEVLDKEVSQGQKVETDKDGTSPTKHSSHTQKSNTPQAASGPTMNSSKKPQINSGPLQQGPAGKKMPPPTSQPKPGLLGTHPTSVPPSDGPKTGLLGAAPPQPDTPVHDAGPLGGDVDMRHRLSDVDMRNVPISGLGRPIEGRLDGPPRDGPHRDGPPRDGAPWDGPPRNGPPRDGPPRDGPPRNGPPRDGLHHNGPPGEGPHFNLPSRDGPHQEGPPRNDPAGPPRDRDMRSNPPFHDEDLRPFSSGHGEPPRDFDARGFRSPPRDEDLRGARLQPFRGPGQPGTGDHRHDIPRDMDLRMDNFENNDHRTFMHGGMNKDDHELYHGRLHARGGIHHGGQRPGVGRGEPEPKHEQRYSIDRAFSQEHDGLPHRGVKRGFNEERERGPGMGRGFPRGGGYQGGRGAPRGGGPWRNDNMGRGNYRGNYRGGRGRAR